MADPRLFRRLCSCTLLLFVLAACDENYSDLIGKDLKAVVEAIDDENHMVVWPRDFSNNDTECNGIDYVTIVPKNPPTHAIEIKTDGNCKVTSIERKARKGL